MAKFTASLHVLALYVLLLSLVNCSVTWTSCGTNLDCGNLEVPLEYATSTSTTKASIALIRYNATVSVDKKLGSLLTNPGGPGASGVNFVAAGAGEAISTITGGLYDIISWDPRGVGATTPVLQCFDNAGDEYDFANAFPSAPNLWLGQFSNSSEDANVAAAITSFDVSSKNMSDACVARNSEALFTSSSAYVAKDMAAIVDELDGTDAGLNYWGFSYGTIFLAEFIQAFPERVGRIVADGVFDSEANAKTYDKQLPNDQLNVRDSLNDFTDLCTKAGASGCTFATGPTGVTDDIATRLDNIFEDLFKNPITISGITISLDIFNVFLLSLLRVPTTWQLVASVLSGLETRDASALLQVLISISDSEPTDRTAAGVGTLAVNPLQCVDNPDTSAVTLDTVISITKSISVEENTPFLNGGLLPLTFCRNFPSTRPLLSNAGVTKMSSTDTILSAASKKILIVNPIHDPTTPLKSARNLRTLLPSSSVLAVRGGSGHTTISHVSLGITQTISDFFTNGTLPVDEAFSAIDQDVFPTSGATPTLVTPSSYNGTYTSEETALMDATYAIGVAFLTIA